ncbi:hypothetical protein SAMN05428642_103113 [Flaviramulus basaltis]|uniref:Uncharacterized protein n=1 Tax=Flaviramulus basaltis TaxID=369401 RepID=A0A1K2IMC1_9FLAO|nr:hypothetical protein [Flaviramulus basaltis]SFZ93402.1 hypothetical protein SAMN05428642_103113 [Flaviramulus basaltis]
MKGLKVKAGALQLTMFITVVIALLLAAFIILIHTHKRFKIQTDFVKETIANADMGMDYAINNNIRLNDTISLDLKEEDYKTVKVHKDHWGIFEKVISISQIKQNRFKKIALLGASQSKLDRTALYIEDNNRPLVVVGNTKIQGMSYLPKQGVRTGNISGHSYYGNSLIYGPTRTSKTELPKLSSQMLEQIKTIQEQIETLNQEQFIDLDKNRTHQNSFYNPLQVVYSNSDINLSNVSLIGHILVQSKTKIIVEASSKLKDVILVAPEIDIKSNTKGTFQAFASKQITVGTHCKLEFPSALVLIEDAKNDIEVAQSNNQKETPFIKLDKNTEIKGTIIYLGNTKNYKAQVFIDENTEVTGEVYCSQNMEFLGSVFGSVFTSNFIANQSGSSYQNHLYNATISIENLPGEYVGLSFANAKKNIAKWLY